MVLAPRIAEPVFFGAKMCVAANTIRRYTEVEMAECNNLASVGGVQRSWDSVANLSLGEENQTCLNFGLVQFS